MSALDDGRIERLLIVRLSAMGDVIHALPAAQALREAYPEAMIGWIIEERWAELLCAPGVARRGARSAQRPLVDWVHTVNLKGWRKSLFSLSTIEQIARVGNDVRGAGYQVADVRDLGSMWSGNMSLNLNAYFIATNRGALPLVGIFLESGNNPDQIQQWMGSASWPVACIRLTP